MDQSRVRAPPHQLTATVRFSCIYTSTKLPNQEEPLNRVHLQVELQASPGPGGHLCGPFEFDCLPGLALELRSPCRKSGALEQLLCGRASVAATGRNWCGTGLRTHTVL